MREPYDTSLEALLADTLARQADRVDATVTLERVRARLEERRRPHRRASVRRPLMLLGVAAALLLPMAALVVGQRPTEPEPAPASAYQALIRRSDGAAWIVVAMRGDGQERLIASVPIPDPGDERRRPQMAVSADGWLATPGSDGLGVPGPALPGRSHRPHHAVPRIRDAAMRGSATAASPRGTRPARSCSSTRVAGTVERASVHGPLTNVAAWTADGTALVTHGDWGRQIVYFGAAPLAGLARHPDRVADPPARPSVTWPSAGSREAGGDQTAAACSCATWPSAWSAPGCRTGPSSSNRRTAPSPRGTGTSSPPTTSIDATFGGTGVWLLLDRRVARPTGRARPAGHTWRDQDRVGMGIGVHQRRAGRHRRGGAG